MISVGCVIAGKFEGPEEAREDSLTLVAAKAGFDSLMREFENAQERISELEDLNARLDACTREQQKTLETTIGTFNGYRAKIAELRVQLGTVTPTSPEAVAERKIGGKMRGRVTVRCGDMAYDIEGSPEFVTAIRAQLAEVA